jgi:hypothetical protein
MGNNQTEVKKHYLAEDFKTEYENYLYCTTNDCPYNDCPYNDPDTTYPKEKVKIDGNPDGTCPKENLYGDLVNFLNAREQAMWGEQAEWKYDIETGTSIEGKKGYECPPAICVKNKEEQVVIMYLRSDQFGFSAPQPAGAWNPHKYPYARYYLYLKGDEKVVSKCIWQTRTIGGVFLWPIVKRGNKWASQYNTSRGVSSYIEDRVDLTLNEIKQFYEVWNENKELPEEEKIEEVKKVLNARGILLLGSECEYKTMCEWLSHFHSFEEYVDFFVLNSFVIEEKTKGNKKYSPKDIFTGKKLEVDSKGKKLNVKTTSLKKADKTQLERVFKNISDWTIKRSETIESLLGQI